MNNLNYENFFFHLKYNLTERKNLHNADSLAHKPAQYTTAVLPRTEEKQNRKQTT